MHKLYGIAFQRVLRFFNKDKITFENVNELLKQKKIEPTHEIIFHRISRQDCKDFVKTPCPINRPEQTTSEIVEISKRLRSQFKALESKVCNRCPFKDSCQKKYLQPASISQNTTRDLLLFMSKMSQYQKLDFVTYKTWNGGYKMADNVVSMLQDLSQGGSTLKQYQILREKQIQKSDQIKKQAAMLENNVKQAIKEGRKKRVPLKQSHLKITTQTFQDLSNNKMQKFTTKMIQQQDDFYDTDSKKKSKKNKMKNESYQQQGEDQLDLQQKQEKNIKKRGQFRNTDRFQNFKSDQSSSQYRNTHRQNDPNSQKRNYNKERKFQNQKNSDYQHRRQDFNRGYQNRRQDFKRGYQNRRQDFNRGYQNKDKQYKRRWENRNDQKQESGGYRKDFNAQRGGQRGQKKKFQYNDRQQFNDRTDKYQRTFKNDRYEQKNAGRFQRDRQTKGKSNYQQSQFNNPTIRRISKSPINPYQKKSDFTLNDLPKQKQRSFESKFNIKQAQYTKYERIPDELRTPQPQKKQSESISFEKKQNSDSTVQRKGRRVKSPTIIKEQKLNKEN